MGELRRGARPLWAIMLLPMALLAEAKDDKDKTVTEEASLDEVTVIGQRVGKDQAGYNAVYGKDISSVYMGKDEVARYKGNSPADVFKGMLGVFSGDARNSGALDPNIRGIQGPGRVPLTIDGTEQAMTVWRGYNGANNRNYLDPNLIGSITVEKGPSLTRGVVTSVGGGVAISTLDVDDVLTPEQTFGGEVKVEAGNNTTKARLPTLLTGQDAKDVVGWTGAYTDPNILIMPKNSSNNKTLSGQDQAIRLALAARQEHFDVIGAYAFRNQGNYFAGKKGSHNYWQYGEDSLQDYKAYMSNLYLAGAEVMNTSNRMTSYLLKATARLPNDHSFQLGLRHTNTLYGEIMPSRLKPHLLLLADRGVPQWPLSEVALSAYQLLYKWQPEDQPLFNVEANLWATRTQSDAYNGGGFPNEPYENGFSAINPNDPSRNTKFRNTALVNAHNNRWGLTLSNVSELKSNLNLILGGSFQHERLYSKEVYDKYEFGDFKASPRTGKRRENEYNINVDWRPTTWLALSAGLRHSAYSSFDQGLDQLRRQQDPLAAVNGKRSHYEMYYMGRESLDEYRARYERDPGMTYGGISLSQLDDDDDELPFPPGLTWNQMIEFSTLSKEQFFGIDSSTPQGYIDIISNLDLNSRDDIPSYYVAPIWDPNGRKYDRKQTVQWQADADGKMHRRDNPFLNGQLDDVDHKLIGEETAGYGTTTHIVGKYEEASERWPSVKKQKDSGWSPLLSATLFVTPNARLYARYSEAMRLPSIFESTVGFSTYTSNSNTRIKPERSRNIEVAYVHDLRDWIEEGRYADIKLAYYRNHIQNVIERDEEFRFNNLDKQKVSGLELQGRYDRGRFFSDLGVAVSLENKVCDEELALLTDPYKGRVATCVDGGFRSGYLRNMVQPKYSINWLLGGRFLDQKLEVGTRVLYHQGAKDTVAQNFYDTKINGDRFNRPLYWTSVVVLDAHVNYKLNRHVNVELAANNLTNRYYLDPLSRALMPAPGRTLRLSLKGRF